MIQVRRGENLATGLGCICTPLLMDKNRVDPGQQINFSIVSGDWGTDPAGTDLSITDGAKITNQSNVIIYNFSATSTLTLAIHVSDEKCCTINQYLPYLWDNMGSHPTSWQNDPTLVQGTKNCLIKSRIYSNNLAKKICDNSGGYCSL